MPNDFIGCTAEDKDHEDLRRPHMQRIAAMGWELRDLCAGAGAPTDWTGWEFFKQLIGGGESRPQGAAAAPGMAARRSRLRARARHRLLVQAHGEWLPLSEQSAGADPEQRQCQIWPDGRTYDGNGEDMTPECAQPSCARIRLRLLDGRKGNEVPS